MEETVHVCIHPFKISVSRPRHDIVKRNNHVLYVKFKRMEFYNEVCYGLSKFRSVQPEAAFTHQ